MKKLFAALMSSLMLIGVLAACGDSGSSASTPAASSGSTPSSASASAPGSTPDGEKKLVYVFIKARGDLSYWDSIAAGGDRAAADFADRADVKVIETTLDLQANLTAMYEAADAGADMIVSASDYKDNLVEVANKFPGIACVIISENIVDQASNIYGIDFSSSEAAFLGGIAAADVAAGKGGSAVGFIGGMDESTVIQEFLVGYIQGAKYYNEATRVDYTYVGDWGDPDTARTQALAQYNDAGAEVIFACAGGSGTGVHTAANEAEKFVVGVDADQGQQYADDGKEDLSKRFITSVLKDVGNGVYVTIEKFLDEGTLPYGKYEILGLAADAVGIVENDQYKELVSEEGRAMIEQAKKDIIDGKIEVQGALGKKQDEIKALINELLA